MSLSEIRALRHYRMCRIRTRPGRKPTSIPATISRLLFQRKYPARTTTVVMGLSGADLLAGWKPCSTQRRLVVTVAGTIQGLALASRGRALTIWMCSGGLGTPSWKDRRIGRSGRSSFYFALYVTEWQQTGLPSIDIDIGLDFIFLYRRSPVMASRHCVATVILILVSGLAASDAFAGVADCKKIQAPLDRLGSVGIQDSHPGLVVIQAVDGPIRFD